MMSDLVKQIQNEALTEYWDEWKKMMEKAIDMSVSYVDEKTFSVEEE